MSLRIHSYGVCVGQMQFSDFFQCAIGFLKNFDVAGLGGDVKPFCAVIKGENIWIFAHGERWPNLHAIQIYCKKGAHQAIPAHLEFTSLMYGETEKSP